MSNVTVYTKDDVSKHNTKNDLWMIIHNKIYDISEFVIEHPGGEEVLIDEAGKDATEAFEDIGHSDEARDILDKYQIGVLDESEHDNNRTFDHLRAGELPEEKSKGSALRVILPALIVIGVLAYKFVLAPKSH